MSATRSGRSDKTSQEANGASTGDKRKIDDASSSEPPKKAQKSLEETMPALEKSNGGKDTAIQDEENAKGADSAKESRDAEDDNEEDNQMKTEDQPQVNEEQKPEPKNETKDTTSYTPPSTLASAAAITQPSSRAASMPSNILEKGIIYFFTRSRVGIDNPESASDLQRTFFVLRPIPHDAKITSGALSDSTNNRLFALPKKTFPKSHSDRFMAFVEKAGTSIADLKEEFMAGNTYDTKTQGTRGTPAVSAVGEGVYAVTQTGRTTHLAYMLTVPEDVGEVQRELGIRTQGSWAVSVKNPARKGPANATLDQGPEWPKEFVDEFRGLAWAPVKMKYLDYANVQILLIGEGGEDGLGGAVEATEKDQKDEEKETPREELEKLEHEDELRVDKLDGDDSIFGDLGISKKDYGLLTKW
ncbi:hypothetical protein EJ05DRAFT_170042 [Pseudovirgaria hyperparasitica]|uniref:Uncharacterized protein n=1 Tax=Pseudovirgaria hyperparasitica TaxID=470096 RepID=A0A6A6VWU2_9PEZI|nr:uncharacterized protein EJ05DRAFT_170042 [Pseudovirgaria hyperparasitica]KAF2753727.1 hypothetical protein EJ05DRAFT_170042 [Pseudovirgaria hyperparasitica]